MQGTRSTRRARVLLIAHLVAGAALAAQLSAPSVAAAPAVVAAVEPSAQFRGGPEHAGVYATRAPVDSAALLWSFATGGPVRSTPAVAGGAVYFGSGDGNLYALDAATGAERWQFRTGEQVHSSPVPADGAVYLGSDDGRLYALAAPTGRGGRPLHRAVFWDDDLKWDYFKKGGREVRDAFRDRGYQVLGGAALGPFLAARIADREPSVVVFASDVVLERGAGDVVPTGAELEALVRVAEHGL